MLENLTPDAPPPALLFFDTATAVLSMISGLISARSATTLCAFHPTELVFALRQIGLWPFDKLCRCSKDKKFRIEAEVAKISARW